MTTAVAAAPSAWLFQANPAMFDIDGFLATNPDRFLLACQPGRSDADARRDGLYLAQHR